MKPKKYSIAFDGDVQHTSTDIDNNVINFKLSNYNIYFIWLLIY
jgi:hypothetical protein